MLRLPVLQTSRRLSAKALHFPWYEQRRESPLSNMAMLVLRAGPHVDPAI